MARHKTVQTNFSAGELAPEFAGRVDADQFSNGAKELTNRRCLISGGTMRRPGSKIIAEPGIPFRAFDFIVDNDTRYVLAFYDGGMKAYLPDGTAAGSLTGQPWTGAIWQEMDYAQAGNTVFLTHVGMIPQIVTRTGASSWSRSQVSFTAGAAGRLEQPYYKVAPREMTLAPSALTGNINLTVSAAWFTAAHPGQRIRYLGRECVINSITSATVAACSVIERLPPTQTLTVASSNNFSTGQSVSGDTSSAHGIVTGIPDGTHLTVVIDRGLIEFEAEDLIGPDAVTAISAVASATPAAVTDWDEQLIGPVYGSPACVELHRNRLCFGGHPEVPNGLIASRIGDLLSFDVGDASDGDAIFETIGDAGASSIVQLHSAEQLLVLTDRGPYYVPESAANPFRPTSIAFFNFGSPWPITATTKTQTFDGGVLMTSGSNVIKARSTGDVNRSWDADEVSLLSSHLVRSPVWMTVTTNFADGPERYAIIGNEDGTIACLQLVEAQRIRNMTPWTTDGEYISGCSLGDQVFVATRRLIEATPRYFLEVFDQDYTLDGAREYSTLSNASADYGFEAGINVVSQTTYHLGELQTAIASEDVPAGPYQVGWFYNSVIETFPPALDDREGPHVGERMRITDAHIIVLNSARFTTNGTTLHAYQASESLSAPPPLRTKPQRFRFLGWQEEPTIRITQPDPLPLTVLAVKTTVAFR